LTSKEIKAIQDEIKAIRELAEAKKRALRETFDKENAELELQQAKLDLQSAIARGDNEAAAQRKLEFSRYKKKLVLKQQKQGLMIMLKRQKPSSRAC
jgi:hypothetical protein